MFEIRVASEENEEQMRFQKFSALINKKIDNKIDYIVKDRQKDKKKKPTVDEKRSSSSNQLAKGKATTTVEETEEEEKTESEKPDEDAKEQDKQ